MLVKCKAPEACRSTSQDVPVARGMLWGREAQKGKATCFARRRAAKSNILGLSGC